MRTAIKCFRYPFKFLFLIPIYFYKYCISPFLPKTCRYIPTCSNYAIIAIKEFGVFAGLMLAVKRIIRCNSRFGCGFDPVPSNIKGVIKWLI